MHTTIRTYETDAEQAREVTSLVEQHFAPKLERLGGFVAYQVITSPDGTLVTIPTCTTPPARLCGGLAGRPRGRGARVSGGVDLPAPSARPNRAHHEAVHDERGVRVFRRPASRPV